MSGCYSPLESGNTGRGERGKEFEIGTSRMSIGTSPAQKSALVAPSPTNAIIPQIVSGLKRLVNKEIGFNIWQRSYHDHVIRDEEDYYNTWQYIEGNPKRWLERK